MNRKSILLVSVCIMLYSETCIVQSLLYRRNVCVSSLPDLIPLNISLTPLRPIVGETVIITVYVGNIGTGNAGFFYVSVLVGGMELELAIIMGLPAGQTFEVNFSFVSQDSGTFSLACLVDAWDDVEEEDETNNMFADAQFITFSFPGGPDTGRYLFRENGTVVHGEEYYSHQYGIWVRESTDITIVGCDLVDSNDIGIYILNSHKVRILNNFISEGKVGIQIEDSSDVTIIDNLISNNTKENIYIFRSSNIIISKNDVSNASSTAREIGTGILTFDSFEVDVTSNNMTENRYGISLGSSSLVNIASNTIKGSEVGITLWDSSNNTVCDNMITLNNVGINITGSNNNFLYHNNFINNSVQAKDTSRNSWNATYPLGGNYWSDFTGEDVLCGVHRSVSAGSDGMLDIPYPIVGGMNRDNYPLISPWPSNLHIVSHNERFACIFSNSSLTNLKYEETGQIRLDIENGTFCNVIVQKLLLDGAFTVVVDGTRIGPILDWDKTHIFISFTYNQSVHSVEIRGEHSSPCTPEFPDIDRNGVIDIFDVVAVATKFGTEL